MRLVKSEVIGMSLGRNFSNSGLEVGVILSQTDCPSLSDALEVDLEHKGKGRPKTFRSADSITSTLMV